MVIPSKLLLWQLEYLLVSTRLRSWRVAVYYNWAGYITEKFEVVLRLRRIFCAEYGLVKVKERLLVFML